MTNISIIFCVLCFVLGALSTAAIVLTWMLRKIADAPQPVSPNPGIALTKAVIGPSHAQIAKEQEQIQAEVDLRHNAEFRAQMREDFNWDPDDDTYGIEDDGSVVQYEQ